MTERQDRVQTWLAARGCPEPVVAGGLAGLVKSWEVFAKALPKGYAFGLDDYLNDLDVRQLIADVWPKADSATTIHMKARLAAADRAVQDHTNTAAACLWGARIAKQKRYTPVKHWWYFAVPKKPGSQLRDDLARRL